LIRKIPGNSMVLTEEIDKFWLTEGRKFLFGGGWKAETERGIWSQALGSIGGFDRGAARQGLAAFSDIKDEFATRLKDLTGRIDAGVISPADALSEFKEFGPDFYKQAFNAGAMHSGNPFYQSQGMTEPDERFSNIALRQESRYAKNAFGQIGNHESLKGAEARAEDYADSLEAQFWNGYVAGGQDWDGVLIHWELGHPIGDHCSDCLDIAANSPYTKETLPTVPKSGDTECLFNCLCRLVYVREDMQDTDGSGGVALSPEIITGLDRLAAFVTTAEGAPVTGNVADLFDDLFSQMNASRAKIAITAGVEQEFFITQRKVLNDQIINLMNATGYRAVPRFAVENIVSNAMTLVNNGMQLIRPAAMMEFGISAATIPVGATVWELDGVLVRVGVVERVERGGFWLQRNDGVVFRTPEGSVLMAEGR